MGRGATGREGNEVVQAHGMPGRNEVTVFSDFCLPMQCWVPQLVVNKINAGAYCVHTVYENYIADN